MVNSPARCSSRHARLPERRRTLPLLALAAGLVGGQVRAGEPPGPPALPEAPETTPATAQPPAPGLPPAAVALCVPAEAGSLRGRLKGAVEADLDWRAPRPQCRGSLRPEGNGLRLVYRGDAPGTGPLLIVFGAGPLRPGQSARHVPVNLTLVREGTGEFYATRGDDKCAFDEVRQSPLDSARGLYRLEGRGYCTQPARTVDGARAVLLSTFDVTAIVGTADKTQPPAMLSPEPGP
jgi:hypothetical protein